MNSLLKLQSICSSAIKLGGGFLSSPSTFTPDSLSSTNALCLQFVRWRKKPRWLPVARTKMFRVSPRIKIPREEYEETKRLYNNYRTMMKAIRYHFAQKTRSLTTAPEVIAAQIRLQEEDHARCIKLNDEWNHEVAIIREKRCFEEGERKKLKILEKLHLHEKRQTEKLERIEQLIITEKEISKTYITRENIDEAIEKALKKTTDYNYCIDLDGSVYKGLRSRPGKAESVDASHIKDNECIIAEIATPVKQFTT